MAHKLSRLQTFLHSKDGSVIPLFGLCIMMLMFMSALAVDTARGYRAASATTLALDAAALTSAKMLRLEKLNDEELMEVANRYFKSNLNAEVAAEATYGSVALLEVNRVTNKVKLGVDMSMPTTFGSLMGVKKMKLPAKSTAIYDARDIELSMMLDVSGSMAGAKISDLRGAAADLVDILMTGNKNGAKHRIAIAPFSTSVNAGTFDSEVAESKGKFKVFKPKNTCVSERTGANAFTDASPASGMFGKKAPSCPTSPIVPLSNDGDTLKTAIAGLRDGGWTAGHLGIAWAWYLLSPEWADIWPSGSTPKAYGDEETTKVAIIMTDGEFNSAYEGDNGDAKQQAEKLCKNMKSSGVTVYTIGFQVPKEALPVLEKCATSHMHFFDAKNGDELRDTFKTIAKKLLGLRLSS